MPSKVDVVLGPEQLQDLDPLGEALDPVLVGDVVGLGFDLVAALLDDPGAGDEDRPPLGQEVEARPLVGEEDGIAQGKLAMQAGPRRTVLVRPAMPARSAIDSIRGLPNRLSPTQIDWKAPDRSAISARSSISRAVVTPNNTPRFGRVKPSFMADCDPF